MSRFGSDPFSDFPVSSPPNPPVERPPDVGRSRAVAETVKFPEGTCGHVVHGAVAKAHGVFGDFASGGIGQHYAAPEMQAKFAQPATNQNLYQIAEHETEQHWAKQPGLPGKVGRTMSKETRYGLLVAERDGSAWNGAQARCEAKNKTTQ